VAVSVVKNDWNRGGRTLRRLGGRFRGRHNDIHLHLHEIGGQVIVLVVRALLRVNGSNVAAWEEFRAAAESVGIASVRVDVKLADDVDAAFNDRAFDQSQALNLDAPSLLRPVRARVASLAIARGLPSTSSVAVYAQAGLLFSYRTSRLNAARRGASLVDKILKGARPEDIPVEQASVFDLLLNVTTAQQLGLAIPASVAAQVTQWVQ
jgi:putative ABC transport system substrate-binding protein